MMLTLVGETAELALDLLEKNGCLLPFCKARTVDGETLVICADSNNSDSTPEDYIERSANSVRVELKRKIARREIAEFTFCSDNEVKFQNEPEHRRVLKIEFQNGADESGIYYFPLSVEGAKAQVGKYLLTDLSEKLL